MDFETTQNYLMDSLVADSLLHVGMTIIGLVCIFIWIYSYYWETCVQFVVTTITYVVFAINIGFINQRNNIINAIDNMSFLLSPIIVPFVCIYGFTSYYQLLLLFSIGQAYRLKCREVESLKAERTTG